MTLPSASSHNASADQTRSPSPAVEFAGGESAVAEKIESGAGRHGQTEADFDEQQEAGAEAQGDYHKRRHRQKESRLIVKRKKAYLDLYDEIVKQTDAAAKYGSGAGTALLLSKIGGSTWTREEKERFFAALARYGRDCLPALAKTIGTKSELEIRLYLLALEAGLKVDAETAKRRKDFLRGDVPAACEIDEECEKALDLTASSLAKDEELHAAEAERKNHGDGWLVDANTAALIDGLLDGESGNERGTHDSRVQDAQKDGQEWQGDRDQGLLTPAKKFFDTSMLLQLSRNLFMNGPPDGDWNYRTAELLDCSSRNSSSALTSQFGDEPEASSVLEPAIYHSALNDLYALAREVTQKLVLATLFQATSRVRAKDDSAPIPAVLASDVHIAVDILGLNIDWSAYWAKFPRRAGLEVYSEYGKYKRGRTGTKNGVKLTYDEVEAELGLSKEPRRLQRKDDLPADLIAEAVHEGKDEFSSALDTEAENSEVSSDGIVELQIEHERRKRSRGLSPDSFARAEERHMRALDTQIDRAEDTRLRELLGLEIRDASDEFDDVPERPKLKKRYRRDARLGWRESAEAMAPWEVECVRKLRMEQEDSQGDDEISSGTGSERAGSEPGEASGDDEGEMEDGNSPMRASNDEIEDDD